MTLDKSLPPSGPPQWSGVPPPRLVYTMGTVETFAFKRLLTSDNMRVIRGGPEARDSRVTAREHPQPTPRLSREITSLCFAESASWSWRPHRGRHSQGRPVSLRRRRGPALLPSARQSPRLPTCPSAWAHPALGRPHPGGAARLSARASLGPPAAGSPSCVRSRGAGGAQGLGAWSPAEGSAAAEEAALS